MTVQVFTSAFSMRDQDMCIPEKRVPFSLGRHIRERVAACTGQAGDVWLGKEMRGVKG